MESIKKKVHSSSDLPSSSSSNWACLPHDLLYLMINKLDTLSDYFRLTAVCKSWNSMALNCKEKRIQLSSNHQLPLLFARTRDDIYKPKLRLYNFKAKTSRSAKVCNFKLLVPGRNKRSKCCGSSHGWLVFFVPKKSELLVLNPFSGSVIHLPPLIHMEKKFIRCVSNVVLSRNPSLGSFEVLAVLGSGSGGNLAYLNFGDQFWTFSQTWHYLSVFTFYKGYFVGVSPKGGTPDAEIASIVSLNVIHSSNNVSSSYIKVEDSAVDLEFMGPPKDYYFVETTNGDLLIVCKLHTGPTYKVFKIMDSNGKLDLTPVVNLDGHSLFLHTGGSCVSVIASNYPQCRPNSIYTLSPSASSYCCRIQEFNLEYGSSEIQLDRWLSLRAFEGYWILPLMKL